MYTITSSLFFTADKNTNVPSPFFILHDKSSLDRLAYLAGRVKNVQHTFEERLPRLTRLTAATTHFDERALRSMLEVLIDAKRAFMEEEKKHVLLNNEHSNTP